MGNGIAQNRIMGNYIIPDGIELSVILLYNKLRIITSKYLFYFLSKIFSILLSAILIQVTFQDYLVFAYIN